MFFSRPARVLRGIDVSLRVRHEAEYAACFVADAGNAELSAVGICGIGNGKGVSREGSRIRGQGVAQHELAGTVELLERCFIASYEFAFGVCNREIHPLNTAEENTFFADNSQMHPAVFELAAVVEG